MPKGKPAMRGRKNDWSQFIVQHSPNAVITTDAQSCITEFNPAAEKLTGYRRQEALGQPLPHRERSFARRNIHYTGRHFEVPAPTGTRTRSTS